MTQSCKGLQGSGQCEDGMNPPPPDCCIGPANFVHCLQPDTRPFRRFVDEESMYQAVTRNIVVTVSPRFLPERSSTEKSHYFWAYTIEIRNRSDTTVQLKTRHWRITDGIGHTQEVIGNGVIGKEPVLEPGAAFEYTSGVPLPTPSGFMAGTYGMVTPDGEHFKIEIPAFSLDSPESKRTIN